MDDVPLDILDQIHFTIEWEETYGSSLPEGMMDVQAEWLNDRYYVIFNNKVVVRNAAELYMYTPPSDMWEKLSSQAPVYNFAVTTYRSKLVLVGGRVWSDKLLVFQNGEWVETNPSMSDKIHVLKDGSWEEAYHSMPTKRRSPSVVCDGEHLVVAGGCGNDGPLANVDVYDGHSWKAAHSLPQPCYLMKSILYDGKWYLMGGQGAGHRRLVYCASLQALIATTNEEDGATKTSSVWTKLPDIPFEYSSPAVFGNRLIVTGPNTSIIHAYFEKSNCWVYVGHLPQELSQNCTVGLPSGELMVVGKEKGSAMYRTFKGFLRKNVQSTEDQIEHLKRENTLLKRRCLTLHEENVQLKEENKKWKSEVEDLQKKPAASGQTPPTHGPLRQKSLDLDKDHTRVAFYLEPMEDDQLRLLGQALGLHYPKLQRMTSNVRNEMVAAWLREEDDVLEVSGPPTKESLSAALRQIGQTGIALKLHDT